MKKIASLLMGLTAAIPALSQEVEMADTLRSEGKIYVVVTILLIILAGLIGYLVFIDRKTGKLEQKLKDHNRS